MKRTSHIVAASILALSCALLTASCIQDPTAGTEPESAQAQNSNGTGPIGEARQQARGPRFTPKEFIFVIETEWDGKDKAGGWQIAYDTSEYAVRVNGKKTYEWNCPLKIGMPRHSEKAGDIPTNRAAALSAEIANDVVWPLLERKESWEGQGALFCIQLKKGMKDLFTKRYPSIGATVEKG